ncbi:hypothetical protein AX14_002756 [Amanita brunnescens Koide BX004]|nr:hypothetical protein AX14_002756 [Amanita brunnescens Koide BX004]
MLSKFGLITFVAAAFAFSGSITSQSQPSNLTQDDVVSYEHLKLDLSTSVNVTSVPGIRRRGMTLERRNPDSERLPPPIKIPLRYESSTEYYGRYTGQIFAKEEALRVIFGTAVFHLCLFKCPRSGATRRVLREGSEYTVAIKTMDAAFTGNARTHSDIRIGGIMMQNVPYVLRSVHPTTIKGIVPVPWESLAQAGFSQNIIVFSHGLDEGKICIGATEAHCDVTNDIEYHRKIDESGFWKIGGATICVTAISSKVCFESKTIIFDTASDFILGPEKEVDSIYTKTFGTANGRSLPESNRGYYGFNWDTTQVTLASIPEISIQVEGKKEWLIKSDHFIYSKETAVDEHPHTVCVGIIAKHTHYTSFIEDDRSHIRFPSEARKNPDHAMPKSDEWVLGIPFMKGKSVIWHKERGIGILDYP